MSDEKPSENVLENLEKVLEPLQGDKKPLLIEENAGINEAVADIGETLDRNAALSGEKSGGKPNGKPSEKPGDNAKQIKPAEKPSWHDVPKRHFELDNAGKIKTRPDGSPIMKRGRPPKPVAGEELAGGGVAGGQGVVIDPVADAPAAPRDDATGPEAGELLTDLADNAARGIGGDNAAMNKSEKEMIRKSARSVTRGRSVWPSLALFLAVAAWGLRLYIQNKGKNNSGTDSRDGNRADTDGQNHPGQADNPPDSSSLKDRFGI